MIESETKLYCYYTVSTLKIVLKTICYRRQYVAVTGAPSHYQFDIYHSNIKTCLQVSINSTSTDNYGESISIRYHYGIDYN